MENPTRVEDLIAIGYTVSDSPHPVERRRLDQAWRALIHEDPSIPARIEADTLDVEIVRDVVVEAAARALRNPAGIERFEGGLDDWRESTTYRDATTDIYFTAAELRRLAQPHYGAGSMSF